jgi:hypothetical protein
LSECYGFIKKIVRGNCRRIPFALYPLYACFFHGSHKRRHISAIEIMKIVRQLKQMFLCIHDIKSKCLKTFPRNHSYSGSNSDSLEYGLIKVIFVIKSLRQKVALNINFVCLVVVFGGSEEFHAKEQRSRKDFLASYLTWRLCVKKIDLFYLNQKDSRDTIKSLICFR